MFPFDDVIMIAQKEWNDITYPFPNFNGSTDEVL